MNGFERPVVLGLSAIVPGITVVASWFAGELYLAGQVELAVVGVVIALFALLVSLKHVTVALQLLTQSPPLEAFCLAVAVDLMLAFAKAVNVVGPDALLWPTWTTVALLATASAVLNWIAFSRRRS